MNHNSRSLAIALLVFFAAIIGGCKENTLISSKISPNNDNVFVFGDTLPILARTVYDDSVITSTNGSGINIYQALGALNDPFFGSTRASTYFQVIPSIFSFNFAGYTVDSAVLIMPYSGFTYGDSNNTTATQKFTVYRVTDGFLLSDTYYPSATKIIDSSNPYSAATTVNVFHLRDSVNVGGINRAPHMRITLNQHFIDDITNAPVTNFSDFSTFINWFNGLCIIPDASQPGQALPYFRLDGADAYTQANILFYYHTPGGSDALTQSFPFSTQYCGHFNKISRDYSGSQAQQYINANSYDNDKILLQNQPGASIDIKIPNISHIPMAVINRAELVITIPQEYSNATFAAPQKIYPEGVAVDANGHEYTYQVADRYPLTSLTPLPVIDGYAKTVNGLTTYTLNIPRELQAAILAKSDTLHLHITGTQDYYGAYRMIAAGSAYSDPKARIKFNVTLTKLK